MPPVNQQNFRASSSVSIVRVHINTRINNLVIGGNRQVLKPVRDWDCVVCVCVCLSVCLHSCVCLSVKHCLSPAFVGREGPQAVHDGGGERPRLHAEVQQLQAGTVQLAVGRPESRGRRLLRQLRGEKNHRTSNSSTSSDDVTHLSVYIYRYEVVGRQVEGLRHGNGHLELGHLLFSRKVKDSSDRRVLQTHRSAVRVEESRGEPAMAAVPVWLSPTASCRRRPRRGCRWGTSAGSGPGRCPLRPPAPAATGRSPRFRTPSPRPRTKRAPAGPPPLIQTTFRLSWKVCVCVCVGR